MLRKLKYRASQKITEKEMRQFVDALKLSIRQNQKRQTFLAYMEKNLGPDARKWRRVVEDNRMIVAEIVKTHINKEGEIVFSEEDLERMLIKTHRTDMDIKFLLDFVEFLKKNRQDALELKKGL